MLIVSALVAAVTRLVGCFLVGLAFAGLPRRAHTFVSGAHTCDVFALAQQLSYFYMSRRDASLCISLFQFSLRDFPCRSARLRAPTRNAMMLEICWTFVALLTLLPKRLHFTVLTNPDECSIETSLNESNLFCLHAPPHTPNIEGYGRINTLIIHDGHDKILDAESVLKDFSCLRRFVIKSGNLTSIISPFPASANLLEVVEITGTSLRTLTARSFADLPALRVLDLRNNALIYIDPTDLIGIPTLQELYLSGNQWKCDESAAWFANASFASLVHRVFDKEELNCAAPLKNRPLLPVMQFKQLAEECLLLKVCECKLVYAVNGLTLGLQSQQQQQQQLSLPRQRTFIAFASVNCSHRGFTDMPSFLPANTTTLHLEGNKITDLAPLKSNSVYKSLLDLYLDDNMIESIMMLDGSYWLERFRLLSLRGNKLTDFPTYAFENVLPNSESAVNIFLGHNPWRCDCEFTPGFQELLIKYGYLVKDISDVRCGPVGNGEFANKQIRELSRTEICVPTDENYWVYPLDILNVLLASLIILILVKLFYDYWNFKRTGKLPWLVARIP
ncbi:protein singed wings 2 isoform X2 [Phymastichus coffea]|uniref:protein singed wings 2 isoform X2 n=1 Tax=Phymastichus coffea TaxID=108790 RepID=UPI00273CD3C6|nr:protein singed wings 2 isoform X2 [Phymastichus coffea]